MKLPFFGGKEPEKAKGKGFTPVDKVRQLMSRGFSETDVVDALRREGFTPEEIDSALTQALKIGVRGEQPSPFPQQEQPSSQPRQEQQWPGMQQQPQSQEQPAPLLPTFEQIKPKQEQPIAPETSLPENYYQSYPTEDYVDYAINERMDEVNKQMGEFSIRYNELEKRMDEIKSQLNSIIQSRSGEQNQIITKVEGVGEGMEDMTTRLSSLEKAFKETLPALIESVRALCDLVQRMKREVQ